MKDATGEPRPLRDLLAALQFVEAEMVEGPMRMGARGTGPAVIHLMVIRELLREEIQRRNP